MKVIADADEEGPIGVVDTALATSSSLDKAHPLLALSRPPHWWSKRCIGDRSGSTFTPSYFGIWKRDRGRDETKHTHGRECEIIILPFLLVDDIQRRQNRSSKLLVWERRREACLKVGTLYFKVYDE